MSIKLIDLADQTFKELGEPSDTSLTSISYWYANNLPNLNNLLNTSYILSQTVEASPELGDNESGIFKTMYYIYYYNKQITSFLGAGGVSTSLEIASDGGVVRFVNKNEIAKSYIQLKKDEQLKLNNLVSDYKLNNFTPSQVSGDDVFSSESWVKTDGYDRSNN